MKIELKQIQTHIHSRSKIVMSSFSIFHLLLHFISSHTLLSSTMLIRIEQTWRLCKGKIPLLFFVKFLCFVFGTEIISSFVELKAENILIHFAQAPFLQPKRQHTNVISLGALIKLSHFILTCTRSFSLCFVKKLFSPECNIKSKWLEGMSRRIHILHCFTKTHDSFRSIHEECH